MELFKPFVNLTKSKSTGKYTLNSVVSVPKSYAIRNISQFETEINGKKSWAVQADIVPGKSNEQEIIEFSVPLEYDSNNALKSTSMIISTESYSVRSESKDKHTDIEFDDAETIEP